LPTAATVAHTLAEALPYLRAYHGKTIVVRFGGAAMADAGLKANFARDVALLRLVGMKPIVVHGGGWRIDELLATMGMPAQRHAGVRVTDAKTLTVIRDGARRDQPGADRAGQPARRARRRHQRPGRPLHPRGADARRPGVDLGFVGEVAGIDVELVNLLLSKAFVPVILPLGVAEDGTAYHIDSDRLALALARALSAEKLILMTNAPGLHDRRGQLAFIVTASEVDALLAEGRVAGRARAARARRGRRDRARRALGPHHRRRRRERAAARGAHRRGRRNGRAPGRRAAFPRGQPRVPAATGALNARIDDAALDRHLPDRAVPFDDAGELDLPGMRRVLDCMVDQGVDGICILANYSEQFLLTDDERQALLALSCEHVAGRVPVIVTCSHFSTRIAGERARAAAAAGAAMIMLMPPYHGTGLRADENGMVQHFAHVAERSRLPIMVQDAPLSGVPLSVPFLVRLAREVPLVRYFKIEVPFAAAKLRALIDAGGDAIAGPFDGEESITLMADLDAGATGTMCSALLPDLIKPVVEHHLPAGAPRRRATTRASCRWSTTRTASAACAPRRP
jgi:acetylglutamate kinase/dihydrodipicolinate synthase/N-acetylneuraminate lyase